MLRVCRERLVRDPAPPEVLRSVPATTTDQRAPRFPRPCPRVRVAVMEIQQPQAHTDDAVIGRNRVTSSQFQAYLRPSRSSTARSA